MTAARAPRPNGFTLVEMLIALAIFALIAGGALVLLRFSVDAELASRASTERMAEARRFLAVWTADLAQAAPRTARDERGAVRPALEAGADGTLVRLTRSGWSNVEGAARPSLQKVEYRWTGRAIERAGYPYPDGAAPDPGSPLLAVAGPPGLRFRGSDGTWRDRWEPQRQAELPVAVELSLPQAGSAPLVVIAPVGVNYR